MAIANPSYVNQYDQLKKANMSDFIRIAISIVIPPVGVFLKVGLGVQFWVNLLLTLFFAFQVFTTPCT